MAKCRYRGCAKRAIPLTSYCEKHMGMGSEESVIRPRLRRHGIKKKAAKKK